MVIERKKWNQIFDSYQTLNQKTTPTHADHGKTRTHAPVPNDQVYMTTQKQFAYRI